jgi:DNA-binding transcriptional LysR family regulator
MEADLADLNAFAAVARAGGFREASRSSGTSASSASEAVRRLEAELGVRLLHRTTRSVAPTEAGARLLERLAPALAEIGAALDVVSSSPDEPAGTLRLNVPVVAARLLLPRLLPPFLAAHPSIRVEVTADNKLVDILAAGCDAGIRYEETLEKDMIAVPIGPREQCYALGASSPYLERRGRPTHPRQLLDHACLPGRFSNGALCPWEFERDGEVIKIDPSGPLIAKLGGATDLLIDAAVAGTGLVYCFEEWLSPHFQSGALKPVLQRWWARFSGPFLYYPSRRHVPAALRAFVGFIRGQGKSASEPALRRGVQPQEKAPGRTSEAPGR